MRSPQPPLPWRELRPSQGTTPATRHPGDVLGVLDLAALLVELTPGEAAFDIGASLDPQARVDDRPDKDDALGDRACDLRRGLQGTGSHLGRRGHTLRRNTRRGPRQVINGRGCEPGRLVGRGERTLKHRGGGLAQDVSGPDHVDLEPAPSRGCEHSLGRSPLGGPSLAALKDPSRRLDRPLRGALLEAVGAADRARATLCLEDVHRAVPSGVNLVEPLAERPVGAVQDGGVATAPGEGTRPILA